MKEHVGLFKLISLFWFMLMFCRLRSFKIFFYVSSATIVKRGSCIQIKSTISSLFYFPQESKMAPDDQISDQEKVNYYDFHLIWSQFEYYGMKFKILCIITYLTFI